MAAIPVPLLAVSLPPSFGHVHTIEVVWFIRINQNNCDKWSYPDLPSAKRSIPHSNLAPVPPFRELPQLSEDESCMSDIIQGRESGGSDSDFQTTSHSERFDQNELSDLIRDLNLSKESSELLASRLNEKNVLHPGTKITFYRRREKDLLPFFTEDNKFYACGSVHLVLKLGMVSAVIWKHQHQHTEQHT
jgi:hypothetical protein